MSFEETIERIYNEVAFMFCDVEQERRKKFICLKKDIIDYVKEKLSEGNYYISTHSDDSIYEERCLLWVVNIDTEKVIIKEFKYGTAYFLKLDD